MNHADVSMQNGRVKRNKKRLPHLYRVHRPINSIITKYDQNENCREITKAYKKDKSMRCVTNARVKNRLRYRTQGFLLVVPEKYFIICESL